MVGEKDSTIPIWKEYLDSGWKSKTAGKTDTKLHIYAISSNDNEYKGIVLAESPDKAKEIYGAKYPNEKITEVREMPYEPGLVARIQVVPEE